jgi:type IV fimbrial biogenesis protein FimT
VLIMRTGSPTISVRRARGFTVVEMTVVMFLMAMILFVAVPAVADWIRNVRVRSTAESIASGLREARMEAVRRNQIVSFWMVASPAVGVLDGNCVRSDTSPSWMVSLDDPSGLCDQPPSVTAAPRIVSSKAAGPDGQGLVIAGLDGNSNVANVAAFDGYGRLRPTGPGGISLATIDVSAAQSGARRLRIQLNAGGDVKMCDRDITVTTDPRKCG